MTEYYKIVDDGYIVGFGTNGNDECTAITEQEYTQLRAVFADRPTAPTGYDYRLKVDLTWELVENEEPDIDDSEAIDIILGGAE